MANNAINTAAEVAANIENMNKRRQGKHAQDGTPPRVHRIQAARDSRPVESAGQGPSRIHGADQQVE